MSTERRQLSSMAGLLHVEQDGDIAILRLDRPQKRNALNDTLVTALGEFFTAVPPGVKAAVLHGAGDHFCAGLDLSELKDHDAVGGIMHSRMWHRAMDQIQFGSIPVVTVMHGAVVGGGLELASATHVRVAESSAFYALPEGRRGIFLGGGGSVRISRLIGASRLTDMMLTGHTYDAQEGQQLALSHYLVAPDAGLAKGIELAHRMAENAPMTNFALMHVLPRISEVGQDQGLLTESLVAAIAQSAPDAKNRIAQFLAKQAGTKVAAPQ